MKRICKNCTYHIIWTELGGNYNPYNCAHKDGEKCFKKYPHPHFMAKKTAQEKLSLSLRKMKESANE